MIFDSLKSYANLYAKVHVLYNCQQRERLEGVSYMIKHLIAVGSICLSTAAYAGAPPPPASSDDDPALFLGLTWTLGNNASGDSTGGVSLKVLSTDEEDKGALAAGVTYNFDGTIGCDLGLAYNAEDITGTVSYDFCKQGPQFGLGGRTN